MIDPEVNRINFFSSYKSLLRFFLGSRHWSHSSICSEGKSFVIFAIDVKQGEGIFDVVGNLHLNETKTFDKQFVLPLGAPIKIHLQNLFFWNTVFFMVRIVFQLQGDVVVNKL